MMVHRCGDGPTLGSSTFSRIISFIWPYDYLSYGSSLEATILHTLRRCLSRMHYFYLTWDYLIYVLLITRWFVAISVAPFYNIRFWAFLRWLKNGDPLVLRWFVSLFIMDNQCPSIFVIFIPAHFAHRLQRLDNKKSKLQNFKTHYGLPSTSAWYNIAYNPDILITQTLSTYTNVTSFIFLLANVMLYMLSIHFKQLPIFIFELYWTECKDLSHWSQILINS